MLALVESTGNHPALADKRERDLPNGVPANSPPPHSAIANGAHQGEQHPMTLCPHRRFQPPPLPSHSPRCLMDNIVVISERAYVQQFILHQPSYVDASLRSYRKLLARKYFFICCSKIAYSGLKNLSEIFGKRFFFC